MSAANEDRRPDTVQDWSEPTYARPSTVRPSAARRTAPPAGSPAQGGQGSRAPRVPFAVLLIGLLVGGMSLLLLLNTASAANELQRHDLAEQDSSVAAQVQELQNEIAASAAPANLARAAQSLGMVPAGNPAFLVVRPDGSIVVRGSAAPVSPAPVAVPRATATKPAAKKPAAKKPTAKKPTATKSVAKKPVAKKPAATKPAATKPAATKPVSSTPSPPGAHR